MDPLKRTQWLASAILIFTAVLLSALLGRVFWLEKHVSAENMERLSRQYTALIPLMGERHPIYFADGTPAALSVRMYNLFADPAFIMDPAGGLNPLKPEDEEKARKTLVDALAPLVKKPAGELEFQIEDNVYYKREDSPGNWVNSDKPRRFLWLQKEVDEDFYNKFMALKADLHEKSREVLKADAHSKDAGVRTAAAEKAAVLYHALDGVGFVKSMKRMYPMGQLAGSIIGFGNQYGGVDGMERQFDDMLKGIAGVMYVTKDARRQTLLIQDQRFTPADDGRSVWLTINPVVQGIAEEQLKQAVEEHGAQSGTAVVMDPKTGHILAIANYPFFDPTNFGKVDPDVRRDRAVTDPFEPGSIWKPFVIGWAIEKHIVKPTDIFDCGQGVYVDPSGRVVRDTHAVGVATVADIIIKSSNIGASKIGLKMGIPNLYEGIRTFGFGSRTGVELPGDQAGIVKAQSEWNHQTNISASFGYEVAATPLQLVRAFSAFANGGYLVTPRVVGAVEESSGKPVPWAALAGGGQAKQIISAETAETMRGIMKEVLGPKGTAKTAASKLYVMFGKTGTAHVAAGSHGTEGHGYGATDYDSSFLVGAPLKDTKLVAIVTLHKPNLAQGYYGGTVSAPAAVAIMERSLMYLQVPSDMAVATVRK